MHLLNRNGVIRNLLICGLAVGLGGKALAAERPVGILGKVWLDVNCNGIIDAGDTTLHGITVSLLDGGGNVLSTSTSGSFGDFYGFPNNSNTFAPQSGSTYTLRVTVPVGYTAADALAPSLPASIVQKISNTGLRATLPSLPDGSPAVTYQSFDFLLQQCGCYETFGQCDWNETPWKDNAAKMLFDNWDVVYPNGEVTIGGNKKAIFTSALAVKKFLPQGKSPKKLQQNHVNPTSDLSELAGEVLALQLSIDFSNAGITKAGLGAQKVGKGYFKNYTLQQLLDLGNTVLGGNTSALPNGIDICELTEALGWVNDKWEDPNCDDCDKGCGDHDCNKHDHDGKCTKHGKKDCRDWRCKHWGDKCDKHDKRDCKDDDCEDDRDKCRKHGKRDCNDDDCDRDRSEKCRKHGKSYCRHDDCDDKDRKDRKRNRHRGCRR